MIKKIPWTDKDIEIANSGKIFYLLDYNFLWGPKKERTCHDNVPFATLQGAYEAYCKMRSMTNWDGSPAYVPEGFVIRRHDCDGSCIIYDADDLAVLYRTAGKADIVDWDTYFDQLPQKEKDRYTEGKIDYYRNITANADKYAEMADAYAAYEAEREKEREERDAYFASFV